MPKDKSTPRGKGNLVNEPKPFTKVSGPGEAPASNHPLHRTMSRVEKALGQFADKEQIEERVIDDKEEWKKCVRALASSPHGQLFLKVMCRHAQVFMPPTPENATKVVLNAAKQEFYFKFVRPFLEATHKEEIE